MTLIHVLRTLVAFSCSLPLVAQHSDTLLSADFTGDARYADLSLLLPWGGTDELHSAFTTEEGTDAAGTTYLALTPTDYAMDYAGYRAGTLRTAQAVDFRFAETVDHRRDTLRIAFDALWESLAGGSGEGGRIVLTLLHDYPAGELAPGLLDSLQLPAPFGRPAYNVRLRNPSGPGEGRSGSLMLYGGGRVAEGEFEQTDDSWLPGFSSEAGGGSPGGGAPYPLSPTGKNDRRADASDFQWQRFTWVVAPERISLYVRPAGTPQAEDELIQFMELPDDRRTIAEQIAQINAVHGSAISELPTLYAYFPQLEGLRVYFRAVDRAYLANLSVTLHRGSPTALTACFPTFSPLRVYPNPSTGQFQVRGPFDGARDYRIVDRLGRPVDKGDVHPEGEVLRLNLAGFPPGVYILQLPTVVGLRSLKLLLH